MVSVEEVDVMLGHLWRGEVARLANGKHVGIVKLLSETSGDD